MARLGNNSLSARSVLLSYPTQYHWQITDQCTERDFPRERNTWSWSVWNEISLHGWIFLWSINIWHWVSHRLLYPVLPKDEIQRRVCSVVPLRPGKTASPNSAGRYSYSFCNRKTTSGFRWSCVNPSWKKIDMHVSPSQSTLHRTAPIPISQASSCLKRIRYLIVEETSDIKPSRILDTSVLDEIRILVPARSSRSSAFVVPVHVSKLSASLILEYWLANNSSAQSCGSLMMFERSSRPVPKDWVWTWFGK